MKNMSISRDRLSGNSGITLIEILIGMVISVVLMLALSMAVKTQSHSSKREINRVDMIHNLQNTAMRMRTELRMAGYQAGVTSDMHIGAITAANLNDITFVYDTNEDGNRETITIRPDKATDSGYDANHPRIVRLWSDGATVNMRPIGDNITGITLKYYDSSGIQLADSTVNSTSGTQANRDNIRKVALVINARSESKDPDSQAYLTDQLAFQVIPRNFK